MKGIFKRKSLWAYFLCCLFLLGSAFVMIERLDAKNPYAGVITWDVAGYYLYLPSFFYDDPGKLNNIEYLKSNYNPFGDNLYQALKQPNGNYVFKYSCGQAIMLLPAFGIAHLWAKYCGYPVDGFSYPYQVSIILGCVFFSFIGLWFMRKALLKYFSDEIVALSVVVLCFATNYYAYVSFQGGLTHGTLFTLYALIIYLTIIFYDNPSFAKAAALGLLSGLAVITRPTEIAVVLIPVLWGVYNTDTVKSRIKMFIQQYGKVAIYMACAFAMGSIQMLYWKKYSGHFIHWSYGQDETFSFLHPHFINGLFSYRKGWFMYTPVMTLSLLGFITLFKNNRNIFWGCAIFTLMNLYITFSWDQWWYAGAFSQRAVIQSYTILLFPLSSFLTWAFNRKMTAAFFSIFILLCTWLNLVMTYGAYFWGDMESAHMTKAYYWRIFGKTSVSAKDKKLLDTDEELPAKLENKLQPISNFDFENNFYNDSSFASAGAKSIVLKKEAGDLTIPVAIKSNGDATWYRAYIQTFPLQMEWDVSKQAQFGIALKKGNTLIKSKAIRLQRITEPNKWQQVFVDIYAPIGMEYDTIEVFFQNAGSETVVYSDSLKIMRVIQN